MSDRSLFRIVYDSLALLPPGAGGDLELKNILDVSKALNREADITGALRCDRVYFLQVLEGPRGAVVATMGRILRDLRHTRIHVLEAAPLPHRDFAGWSMELVPQSAVAIARLTNPDLVDIVPTTGSEAARSLRALLDLHRGHTGNGPTARPADRPDKAAHGAGGAVRSRRGEPAERPGTTPEP